MIQDTPIHTHANRSIQQTHSYKHTHTRTHRERERETYTAERIDKRSNHNNNNKITTIIIIIIVTIFIGVLEFEAVLHTTIERKKERNTYTRDKTLLSAISHT